MQRMRNLSPQTRAKRKAEILTAVYSRSHSVPSLAKLYSLSQNTIYAWIKQQRSQESKLSKSSDAVLTQVHVRSSTPAAIPAPTAMLTPTTIADYGSASPKFLEVAVAKCQYPESGYLQENDCGRQEQEQKQKQNDEQQRQQPQPQLQPLSSPPSIIHKASLSFSSYSFVIKGKIDSARLILILKTLEGSC